MEAQSKPVSEAQSKPVPETQRQPVLEVRGLTAGYGGPPILHDVHLSAQAGKITAIVGPNGAGKSTFMKATVGLIRHTAGEVFLNGVNVGNQAAERMVRHGIAYVPQVANVFPSLTVRENLEMGGYVRRSGVHERAEQVCEMFPDLRLALRRPAGTLSGGQRNMLAMARGLMVDPAVLMLDEPTAGLSPRFEGTVWEHILTVVSTGVSVVVVEQHTRRALAHADWAYVLVLGRNRLEGKGADLLNDEALVNLYIGGGV